MFLPFKKRLIMETTNKHDTIKEGLIEILEDALTYITSEDCTDIYKGAFELRITSYINLLKIMCCDTCEYQENDCPVKTADTWSRYGNYCNEYRVKVNN
jgi:hypothetical protein